MKFGKRLARAAASFTDPAFSKHLLDYKALKKIIKKLAASPAYLIAHSKDNGGVSSVSLITPSIANTSPTLSSTTSGSYTSPSTPLPQLSNDRRQSSSQINQLSDLFSTNLGDAGHAHGNGNSNSNGSGLSISIPSPRFHYGTRRTTSSSQSPPSSPSPASPYSASGSPSPRGTFIAPRDDIDYAGIAAHFTAALEREISKINGFYLRVVTQLQSDLAALRVVETHSGDLSSLSDLCESIDQLRKFVVLNYLGVLKIVKKHDKNTIKPVADTMIPFLYSQNFYNSHAVAALYTQVEAMSRRGMRAVKKDDFTCPICQDLLECPVVLSCSHRFCWKCLRNASSNHSSTHDACPVCLKPQLLDPSNYFVDNALVQFIKAKFPKKSAPVPAPAAGQQDDQSQQQQQQQEQQQQQQQSHAQPKSDDTHDSDTLFAVDNSSYDAHTGFSSQSGSAHDDANSVYYNDRRSEPMTVDHHHHPYQTQSPQLYQSHSPPTPTDSLLASPQQSHTELSSLSFQPSSLQAQFEHAREQHFRQQRQQQQLQPPQLQLLPLSPDLDPMFAGSSLPEIDAIPSAQSTSPTNPNSHAVSNRLSIRPWQSSLGTGDKFLLPWLPEDDESTEDVCLEPSVDPVNLGYHWPHYHDDHHSGANNHYQQHPHSDREMLADLMQDVDYTMSQNNSPAISSTTAIDSHHSVGDNAEMLDLTSINHLLMSSASAVAEAQQAARVAQPYRPQLLSHTHSPQLRPHLTHSPQIYPLDRTPVFAEPQQAAPAMGAAPVSEDHHDPSVIAHMDSLQAHLADAINALAEQAQFAHQQQHQCRHSQASSMPVTVATPVQHAPQSPHQIHLHPSQQQSQSIRATHPRSNSFHSESSSHSSHSTHSHQSSSPPNSNQPQLPGPIHSPALSQSQDEQYNVSSSHSVASTEPSLPNDAAALAALDQAFIHSQQQQQPAPHSYQHSFAVPPAVIAKAANQSRYFDKHPSSINTQVSAGGLQSASAPSSPAMARFHQLQQQQTLYGTHASSTVTNNGNTPASILSPSSSTSTASSRPSPVFVAQHRQLKANNGDGMSAPSYQPLSRSSQILQRASSYSTLSQLGMSPSVLGKSDEHSFDVDRPPVPASQRSQSLASGYDSDQQSQSLYQPPTSPPLGMLLPPHLSPSQGSHSHMTQQNLNGTTTVWIPIQVSNNHPSAVHSILGGNEQEASLMASLQSSLAMKSESSSHSVSVGGGLNGGPMVPPPLILDTLQHPMAHSMSPPGPPMSHADIEMYNPSVSMPINTATLAHAVVSPSSQRRTPKFLCDHPGCHDGFNTRFSLKRHAKIHSGEKPFACDKCPKSFAEKSTLVRHQRIHTGEKPYVCSWAGCSRSFSDRTNVKRHEAQHEAMRDLSIEEQQAVFAEQQQIEEQQRDKQREKVAERMREQQREREHLQQQSHAQSPRHIHAQSQAISVAPPRS